MHGYSFWNIVIISAAVYAKCYAWVMWSISFHFVRPFVLWIGISFCVINYRLVCMAWKTNLLTYKFKSLFPYIYLNSSSHSRANKTLLNILDSQTNACRNLMAHKTCISGPVHKHIHSPAQKPPQKSPVQNAIPIQTKYQTKLAARRGVARCWPSVSKATVDHKFCGMNGRCTEDWEDSMGPSVPHIHGWSINFNFMRTKNQSILVCCLHFCSLDLQYHRFSS